MRWGQDGTTATVPVAEGSLSGSDRAAVYRQLAIKLREIALDDMDDQSRGDFLELANMTPARLTSGHLAGTAAER